jgi:hypothetical protein
MHKIAPTLLEKCEALALAYEAELEEKEVEIADAERVVRKRQAEIDAIRKQLAELPPGDDAGGVDVDRAQEDGLAALVREAEALLEVEQRAELRRLSSISQNHAPELDRQDGDSEALVREKLNLALLLHRAQAERRALVAEVVQNLSVAGMGERQSEYKRLITGALGVREEDVEAMLPDILEELEEARERDRLEASPL